MGNKESRAAASAAGWTPERRARQRRLIHRWAPWRKATGPKSVSGKSRSALNSLRHGARSAVVRRLARVLGALQAWQVRPDGDKK